MKFDIVVVSSPHKRCLTAERLDEQNIPYIQSITPDYDYPHDSPNIIPRYEQVNVNKIGAYRCFEGHKLAASLSDNPYTLIFEDDVKFDNPN